MSPFDRVPAADYHAVLLRLWRDSDSGAWRVALQHVEGGERLGFIDLEHLIVYLLQLTADRPAAQQGAPRSDDHGSP